MRYYLGPLVLDSSVGFPAWVPPVGTVGMVHLASIPDHQTGGWAFIATPDAVQLGKDYISLGQGDLRSIVPAEKQRSIFASALGLKTVDGTSLVEWLWTAMTLYADPLGDTFAKPIIPNGRILELRLGGHGVVFKKPFNLSIPEAVPIIDLLQKEYASLRTDSLDGKLTDSKGALDDQKYLKVLDYWGDKYGVSQPQDVFIPSELPTETPVKHETTITDSFDRADDASSLGSSSEGWSWTTLENTMGIYSNKARYYSFGNHTSARANSDLSSADHYAQGTANISATDITMAVITRKDSSGTFTYYLYQLAASLTQVRIYKRVGGTYTLLTSPSFTTSTSTDYVLKGSANGSSIELLVDGVSKSSTTDTAISSNLRCGIAGYQGTGSSGAVGTINDWSAADISAGGSFQSAWARGSNIYLGRIA